MQGPFGGAFEAGKDEAREAADPRLVTLLAGDDEAPRTPGLVPLRAREGALVYEGALHGLSPLGAGATLAQVESALRLLEELHAAGRAHGDLRPAHVWVGESARLSFLAKPVDAGQLLRARLAAGADPADVDYVAPEILAGAGATPSSDVFSAAALVHAVMTGKPPHGRPRVVAPVAGLDGLVLRALDADPERRPRLSELRAEVAVAARQASASTVPRVALIASPGAPTKHARQETPVILSCLLAIGGLFVLSGALWLAAVSWDVMGSVGRFALLFALSIGTAIGSKKLEDRSYARSGFALLAIVTQLLWANGAYVIVLLDKDGSSGHWCALASIVTLVTFGFALSRRSVLLAILATVDAALASGLLGATISTGSAEGPAIWCLLTAAFLAGLATLGERRAGLRVGVPLALGALAFLLSSWVSALVLLEDDLGWRGNVVFGLSWPWLLVAVATGASFGLRRLEAKVYGGISFFALGVFLTLTPTIQALAQGREVGIKYAATVIGAGLVIAAFRWPLLARDQGLQLLSVLAGLVSLVAAPSILAMAKLTDKDGLDLLRDALDVPFAERSAHPFFTLPYLAGTCAALVALGLVFSRDAERKLPYRALELAGIAAFTGTLTVASLARQHDLLYPAVLFTGGGVALGVGVFWRHLLLVVIPGGALVVNAWIQYFEKLSDTVPLALLLMGFGVGVLVGGVLFERKVRPWLPEMKTWA